MPGNTVRPEVRKPDKFDLLASKWQDLPAHDMYTGRLDRRSREHTVDSKNSAVVGLQFAAFQIALTSVKGHEVSRS